MVQKVSGLTQKEIRELFVALRKREILTPAEEQRLGQLVVQFEQRRVYIMQTSAEVR